MKKLKFKVFLIVFSLLTTFTLVIFVSSTVKNYLDRRSTILDILMRIPKTFEGEPKRPSDIPPIKSKTSDDSRKIYLVFTIYTIVLDENGKYKEIINNTSEDNFDDEYIKEVAISIIENHQEKIFVGNLYTSKYAYIFTLDNNLIIMDNRELNSNLLSNLVLNLVLFILCELLIFVFTTLITKWIIAPVNKMFEKQKMFVADASHELKTPLSVMIASADAYFNDKDEKWVKNMKSESERMIKLVTELLDLAQTEQDIVMEENNLSNIIEGSILTFESLFYENKIKLKYNINQDIKMICNESLIIELMSILIDNAIKYCTEKGQVFVDLYEKNKQIFLEVKNTGIPIKKEDEEKIFERFYKVDVSRNRNSNNYGLGLAIAKNIVEKHGGKISAHSNCGYTTFKIIWSQK